MIFLFTFLSLSFGAAQNSSMSNSTTVSSQELISTTTMYLGPKTETVTSTITTSVDSSYILESPLPTLISGSSDSILISNSIAITSSMNNGSVISATDVSVASNSIESVTKVSSVTPTSVLSSGNIASSTASLSITPFSTQTAVVALNNTPSSSLADKSVSTNITPSINKPSTSLTQTYNLTQSTQTDSLAVTKTTPIISTSTTKVTSKVCTSMCTSVFVAAKTTKKPDESSGDHSRRLVMIIAIICSICVALGLLALFGFCKRKNAKNKQYRLYDDNITIPGFSEYGGMVRLSDLGRENYEEIEAGDTCPTNPLKIYDDEEDGEFSRNGSRQVLTFE